MAINYSQKHKGLKRRTWKISKFFWKRKRKKWKRALERYQNLSEEEREKKCQW